MDTFEKALTFIENTNNQTLILTLPSNFLLDNLLDLKVELNILTFIFINENKKFKKKIKLTENLSLKLNTYSKLFIIDNTTLKEINNNINDFNNIDNINDEEKVNLITKLYPSNYKIKVLDLN